MQNLFTLFLHPYKKELVAQLVEQYTFNVWVLGSSPSQFTNTPQKGVFFYALRL